MPPKVKTESTELQVFNLENLNPALLPELATFKEIQLKVVAENPFIAITDVASRDLAKKYRTNRVTARTTLMKQDTLISSKFNEAKTRAKGYISELIDITKPGEEEQQKEIDRDEAELEAKRQEKARLEQQRIDNIKKELEDYVTEWKNAFNLMTFDSIIDVSANFLESYTSFDTTILQEFEALFPTKVEELSQLLSDKTVSLTNAENARLEKLRIDLELKRTRELIAAGFSFDGNNYFVSDFKRLDMPTILSQSDSSFDEIINGGITELKRLSDLETERLEQEAAELRAEKARLESLAIIAEAAEAKAKKEREDFEKEKAEFEAQKKANEALANAIYDLPKTLPTEKVEIPEILVPEIPTVNVCTSEKVNPKTLYPLTPDECISPETTWDDIANDFKTSGEKSYSVWLKNNYNVPTKL